jgi:mannosyltransferase OCH1-like enzyme
MKMGKGIPRTFYLTYRHHSAIVDKRIRDINTLYPEFDIKFYDDAACIDFLESNYSDDYAKTFLKINHGAHKADFFRYCVLYKNGGCYIDLDNIPQKNIWDLVNKYNFTSCLRVGTHPAYRNDLKYNKKHIHQGFIATEPNSPILKHLINHMVNNPRPHVAIQNNPEFSELAPLAYHLYVRYFYKYLLDVVGVKELFHSTEYVVNGEKIFLIDTEDTSIMKYGVIQL